MLTMMTTTTLTIIYVDAMTLTLMYVDACFSDEIQRATADQTPAPRTKVVNAVELEPDQMNILGQVFNGVETVCTFCK